MDEIALRAAMTTHDPRCNLDRRSRRVITPADGAPPRCGPAAGGGRRNWRPAAYPGQLVMDPAVWLARAAVRDGDQRVGWTIGFSTVVCGIRGENSSDRLARGHARRAVGGVDIGHVSTASAVSSGSTGRARCAACGPPLPTITKF
jgi:hypothetical protein